MPFQKKQLLVLFCSVDLCTEYCVLFFVENWILKVCKSYIHIVSICFNIFEPSFIGGVDICTMPFTCLYRTADISSLSCSLDNLETYISCSVHKCELHSRCLCPFISFLSGFNANYSKTHNFIYISSL